MSGNPSLAERPVAFTRPRTRARLLVLLAALLVGSLLEGQDLVPYVEAGLGRRQGDFGTPVRSTFGSGYATFGAGSSRWDASLTVPYLRLDREGGGLRSQDRGIGDTVARGLYRLLPETEEGWSLDGEGALKLATADDTKGLGTGRTDLGAFLALHQQLGLFRWTLSGGWIQGASANPSGATAPLSSGNYVLGLGATWDFERNRWGLTFEARGPAYQGQSGARELSLDLFHRLATTWALKANLSLGLSDGGPRQGLGIAVIHIFP